MKKLMFKLSILLILSIVTQNLNAQDWPNLKRYAEDNLVLGEPAEGEQRVVFMGNSITEGWLTDSTSFFYSNSYINRGIGGQTTPQMLIRFRPDVINLKPTVVVILAGINDIAGNTGPSTIDMISDNLMSMVDLALTNNIKVVLSSVLPAYDFPWKPNMNPAEKVIELNERLKNYARQKGIIYLDYFSAMVDDRNGLQENLTYDGVHPNISGYKVMEKLAQGAIEQALNN